MIELSCCDCMERMGKMQSGTVDLVVTDPPYDIDTHGAGMYKQDDKRYIKRLSHMSGGISEGVLDELCRVMKKINIYIFCSQKQILPLTDYFVRQRDCNWNLITWSKTNPVPACGNKYVTDTEYVLFFREKGVRVYGEYQTKKTHYLSPLNVVESRKYGHPTVKPLEIVRNLVVNSSLPCEVVFDPYMGSGTVGVAARELGRAFIGTDIEAEYVETARKRIFSEGEDYDFAKN